MINTRKKIRKVLLLVLAALVVLYVVILLDTNSVMAYAKTVYQGSFKHLQ